MQQIIKSKKIVFLTFLLAFAVSSPLTAAQTKSANKTSNAGQSKAPLLAYTEKAGDTGCTGDGGCKFVLQVCVPAVFGLYAFYEKPDGSQGTLYTPLVVGPTRSAEVTVKKGSTIRFARYSSFDTGVHFQATIDSDSCVFARFGGTETEQPTVFRAGDSKCDC